MYSVTYRLNAATRRKTYKTLTGAQRSIWRWLIKNKEFSSRLAVLYSPSSDPQFFDREEQLPFEEKVNSHIDFYSTQEWKRLRYSAFKKYENKCACCGATPQNGVSLHVDHIKPRSKFPELTLEIENLQILCEACNLGKLNTDQTKWRL